MKEWKEACSTLLKWSGEKNENENKAKINIITECLYKATNMQLLIIN